jgi:hypothetical protein
VKPGRDLLVHGILLLAAVAVALVFWLRDESPAAEALEMVEVWPGSPKQVENVSWEGEDRKVSLAAHRDEVGRYFIGSLEEQVAKVKPKPARRDAGAAADAGAPSETVTERKKETTRFVSAGAADKLLEKLAPLRAYRALGQIEPAREEEFGLKKPTGTLRVSIAGQQHGLLIGGRAPGDADYYARRLETGEVYAVPGEIVRALLSPTSRLLEQDLHAWEPEEVTRVVISAGEVQRELVPVEGKKAAWANPGSPGQQDETAGNWMSKLERLRIMRYVQEAKQPEVVVQVDYFAGRRKLGFLQLVKIRGQDDKPDYQVRTEYTRWYGTVFRSTAEQLEQDLGSVIK